MSYFKTKIPMGTNTINLTRLVSITILFVLYMFHIKIYYIKISEFINIILMFWKVFNYFSAVILIIQ